MLNVGIKKEIMFFGRSFRFVGVLIASVVFAVISPLMMSLSYNMMSGLMDSGAGEIVEDTDTAANGYANADDIIGGMGLGAIGDMFTDEDIMPKLGGSFPVGSMGKLRNYLSYV